MYPKVNQNILLTIKGTDFSFKSIIADIKDSELVVASPADRKNVGLITAGTELDIYFQEKDKLYKFTTNVIEKTRDKIPLYHVTKPTDMEIAKIQRRENYRIRTSIPLKMNESDLTTIDLSVGGALISCDWNINFSLGDNVEGVLFIPIDQSKKLDSIPFKGQIRRIEPIKPKERKSIAIEFTDIARRDQEKITQFSIERQRQKILAERQSV